MDHVALNTPRSKRLAQKAVTPKTSSKKRRLELDSNSWEVHELLNHKTVDEHRFFLVRWKGYTAEHDSWERESNLQCPKILKNYLKKNNM